MAKRKATSKGSGEVGPVLELIVAMTDQFCREQLNEEYALLCRRLAEKLARKRPSPLLGGKPETWACGIIRTIGWVNFLDDSSNKPHMKLTAIDKAFGVGESTGQGKSKTIRTMLKIPAIRSSLDAAQPDGHEPDRLDDRDQRLRRGRPAFEAGVPGRGIAEGPDPLHPRRPSGRFHRGVNHEPHREPIRHPLLPGGRQGSGQTGRTRSRVSLHHSGWLVRDD